MESVISGKIHLGSTGVHSLLSLPAAGSGTKCVGHPALGDAGVLLVDNHAEVVARRALTRYLAAQIDAWYADTTNGNDTTAGGGAGKTMVQQKTATLPAASVLAGVLAPPRSTLPPRQARKVPQQDQQQDRRSSQSCDWQTTTFYT